MLPCGAARPGEPVSVRFGARGAAARTVRWQHHGMTGSGLPSPVDERVLDLVRAIPAGRVLTYGDLAREVGAGGPRQVGRTLARFGGGVPWHRVVRADGSPPPGLADEALAALRAERTPLCTGGRRVDLGRARWRGTVGA